MADNKTPARAARPAPVPTPGGQGSTASRTAAARADLAQDAPAPRWTPGLGFLAAGTLLTALLLELLGAVLAVPGGWGIDDLLGWPDARHGGGARLLMQLWSHSGRNLAAWLYLALDSMAFVPLYGSLLLGLAMRLARALGADKPPQQAQRERRALTVLVPPVLTLMVVDLLENGLGLVRLGTIGTVLAVAATVLGAGALYLGGRLRQPLLGLGRRGAAVTAALAVATLVLGSLAAPGCSPLQQSGGTVLTTLGCGAHVGKLTLAALAPSLVLATALGWLCGVSLPAQAPAEVRAARAARRSMLSGMVLRSRYVLLVLAALAALLLVLDPGRDALYAMAVSPFHEDHAGTGERLLRSLGMAAAFAATGLAVWLLLFACWLWTRGACQLRRPHSPAPSPNAPEAPGQTVAQHWARALGLVPMTLMVLLCAQVVRETVMSQAVGANAPWQAPVLMLLAAGLGGLALGAGFLAWHHTRPEVRCFDVMSWPAWAARTGIVPVADASVERSLNFRFMGWLPPQALLPLLLALLLVCRTLSLLPLSEPAWQPGHVPTLALPVLLLSVALWSCLLGWLTLLEVATARPWVGLLALAVLLPLALGWTANDALWPAVAPEGAASAPELRLLAFSELLAALLLLGQALALLAAQRRARPGAAAGHPRRATARVVPLALLALALLVLWGADHGASSRGPAGAAALRAAQRPTLDAALAGWLQSLCSPKAQAQAPDLLSATTCQPDLPLDDDGTLRVYLVASEGQGMRAAAWTAFALQQLGWADPRLPQRIFAIAGVSGGALGAAVLRACSLDGQADVDCLEHFARADLLSPLVSAGLFEDVLAQVLPTAWCTLPGCGFLSRAAWFEQALETSAAGLRLGLMASRQQQAQMARAHVPYLLLEAAWEATGERAIASDLHIDWRQFPGARDQLGLAGTDLALGTAAHNAARGAGLLSAGMLWAPPGRCQQREAGDDSEGEDDGSGALRPCGRVGDGTRADPGAAQATMDLLNALAHCLAAQPGEADQALYPHCMALDPAQRSWLREHLLPQVLLLRAAPPPAWPAQAACAALERRGPTAQEMALRLPRAGCGDPEREAAFAPERPACPGRPLSPWERWAGPPGASPYDGTPSSAQALAEVRRAQAVAALRDSLGDAARLSPEPPVRLLDLRPDGTRYPTGWLMSALGVERMKRQARTCLGAAQR